MTESYHDKGRAYFTAARYDVLSLLQKNYEAKILEIGAGGGDTLLAAKAAGLAGEVHGVDITRLPNSNQRHPKIDQFHVIDVETEDMPYPPETFDVVITADLLEHLREPSAVIAKTARLLKPGGLWIASIPNFRHYTVLDQVVLRGDFKYQLNGPLDRTHMRFFCKRNISPLFEQAGLKMVLVEINRGPYGVRQKLANYLTFKMFDDLFVFQYRTVARKPLT